MHSRQKLEGLKLDEPCISNRKSEIILLLFKEEWLRVAQTRWLVKLRSLHIDFREAFIIWCASRKFIRKLRDFTNRPVCAARSHPAVERRGILLI